jgi:transposase
MTPEINITTERIDVFPLLLEIMKRVGLPEIIDRHLKRHGLHQGLSWGWIATIRLAHMLTTSDHRKLPVQAWVRQAHATIERITCPFTRSTHPSRYAIVPFADPHFGIARIIA